MNNNVLHQTAIYSSALNAKYDKKNSISDFVWQALVMNMNDVIITRFVNNDTKCT